LPRNWSQLNNGRKEGWLKAAKICGYFFL